MQRRQFVKCLLGTPLLVAVPAFAAVPELRFEEMYAGNSVLGLQFSEKLKSLSGKRIRIRGFMAPPLKAEAAFLILTSATPIRTGPTASSS